MAYSPLVPNANNTVGADLTAMQENFSLLESAQIVDSGSTADGDYWRFEDGLQMCIFDFIVTNDASTLPLYYIWSFPFPFIELPAVSAIQGIDATGSPDLPAKINVGIRGTNSNTNQIELNYVDLLGAATNQGIVSRLTAIGRWK